MIFHFLRIIIISLLILGCMFLPFIPGSYDGLAVTLSFMSQLFAMAGLLLILPGLLWLVYETIKRRKKNEKSTNTTKTWHFAVAALVAAGIVAIVISLGALLNNNRALGIISLIFFTYWVTRFIAKLKQMKNDTHARLHPIPYYLICIPVIVALCRFLFIIPATEYSRNYAIRQSEQLIQDIEAFHNKNGYYPLSLLSVNKDYEPSVTGIKE